MAGPHEPSHELEPELTLRLDGFEQAWRVAENAPPSIDEFISSAPDAGRRDLLIELIMVDLEYRWRRAAAGGAETITFSSLDTGTVAGTSLPIKPQLEDYIQHFPALGDCEVPLALICEEFRVRCLWGDRPAIDSYATRFPTQHDELKQLFPAILQEVDAQRDADRTDGRPDDPYATQFQRSRTVPLERFVDDLVDSGLVANDEISRLQQQLPADNQSSDSLAQRLVENKKLTEYQASALCRGATHPLVFGEYIVVDKLGQGGMGVVLKARHRRMRRHVAIKILPPAMLNDDDAVQRFYREVEAAAQLEHPNIVIAFDASEHDGMHYLVMQYIAGRDLQRVVAEEGPLPVETAVDYIRQAATGLAYAHEKGLVHRDIKPSNLLLNKKGTVKILDMGLARLRADAPGLEDPTTRQLTYSGQMMGTVDYMSPEQAEDTRSADARADIYSLGCTLYRLLTGEPVYAGETMMQKLLAHREVEIPSLRNVREDVPVELDALFQRMIAKRPQDRPASMGEVIQTIDGLAEASPSPRSAVENDARQDESSGEQSVTDKPTLPAKPVVRAARKRTLVILAGSVLFAIAGFLTSPLWKDERAGKSEPPTEPPADYALEFAGPKYSAIHTPLVHDWDGPFTVEAFINMANEVDGGAIVHSTTAWQGEDANGFSLSVDHQDGIEINVYRPGGRHRRGTERGVAQRTRWYHVAAVYDGHNMALFVDGNRLENGGVNLILSNSPFRIGAGLNGSIDEVRISNIARYHRGFKPERRLEADKNTLLLYHFDELDGNVVIDSSGNNNHGTIKGEFERVQADDYVPMWENYKDLVARAPEARPSGHQLQFDGVDDYVDIPTLKYDGNGPLTVEAVVTLEAEKPSEEEVYGPIFNDGRGFLITSSPRVPGFRSISSHFGEGFQTFVSEIVLPNDVPFHIAAVVDAGSFCLYVNGTRQCEVSATLEASPEHFLIGRGRSFDTGGLNMNAFTGRIDEVRLSKGARYKGEFVPSLPFEPDEDTLALYHFDEGEGDQLIDSSGNDHHGTIIGATWVMVQSPPVDQPQERIAPPLTKAPFNSTSAKLHQQAWADHLGVPIAKDFDLPGGEKLTMMLIPPGEFQMGTNESERTRLIQSARKADDGFLSDVIPEEGPQHRVLISRPFYLGKYELSRAAWRTVIQDSEATFEHEGSLPVEVTWEGARRYIDELNQTIDRSEHVFALPTEAQWEYACRAGTPDLWCCGNAAEDLNNFAWFNENAQGEVQPVGRLQPNAWGLHDMHGNLWEWCADWYSFYKEGTAIDPKGPSQVLRMMRVFRGGSARVISAEHCRSALRHSGMPQLRHDATGFRVAANFMDEYLDNREFTVSADPLPP